MGLGFVSVLIVSVVGGALAVPAGVEVDSREEVSTSFRALRFLVATGARDIV